MIPERALVVAGLAVGSSVWYTRRLGAAPVRATITAVVSTNAADVALFGGGIGIGTASEHRLDDGRVPTACREVQRRHAVDAAH